MLGAPLTRSPLERHQWTPCRALPFTFTVIQTGLKAGQRAQMGNRTILYIFILNYKSVKPDRVNQLAQKKGKTKPNQNKTTHQDTVPVSQPVEIQQEKILGLFLFVSCTQSPVQCQIQLSNNA